MKLAILCAAAAAMLTCSTAVATKADDISTIIGATHWQPCYYITQQPSLLDGAVTLKDMGTRLMKVDMTIDGSGTPPYPWNSDWSGLSKATRIVQVAQHPYYASLFNNTLGTNYSTFIAVTVAVGTPSFCDGPIDAAEETSQFAELTSYLMSTYAGRGYTFIFQHWEGDWFVRCGGYNASQPANATTQGYFRDWLAARQAGVDQGRASFCAAAKSSAAGPLAGLDIDCSPSNGAAIMAAAGVNVYHASEVNLVQRAMQTGAPENILAVIPHVQLDMVSYSSYDTESITSGNYSFGAALDFLAAHHNRTASAPAVGVYVGEYGIAQNKAPLSVLQSTVENVIAWSMSIGPSGVRRAAHTLFWELMDNEAPDLPGQRCNTKTGPVFNPNKLNGFWLVRPDGSKSWAWDYLRGVINGSVPVPTPPSA